MAMVASPTKASKFDLSGPASSWARQGRAPRAFPEERIQRVYAPDTDKADEILEIVEELRR